ncbi:hypoxia inducible factor 1 subunit alpha a isoform X1 [Silurus meridionalis]|uniref:hypoxia inducible factor 1 subunit alpha a isoform X1 n=2 Tax=Silurus meridionalis TaxID=175797 RepID=UPI001EEC3982|nr:hypoxia inducible factor 1 subunit alpha a isoform X1 [Silurus meridionalis]XP_046693742.1 hypoxia inducible factor 1 subunit alpha a isoform X1 [Silurus meridionalis]XP_046693750.1 hypoxia inducible factor 1 subunit alpha a isoform X1 [Silurus meridionalis]
MTSGATSEKKRQSCERRKARCRDAARCRREKETEVFNQLANQLPLHHSITESLDKASVIRLTLSYLHLRSALNTVMMGELSDLDSQWTAFCLKALDGFLMILSQDGDVVYTSETVSKCLGISQIDLSGQSVYDFTHPCDHEEIREMLLNKTGSCKKTKDEQSFLLRMKCTLTSRGRTVNLRSATWKVLHCSGHVRVECTRNSECEESNVPVSYLVLICEPIPHPANIEVLLDSRTFLSKHTLDMRFSYCDERITELLGYDPEDLLQRSVYEFYHALDSDSLTKTHHNLFVKGQACTGQYRMLVKGGGFVWVETQATIIYNSKNSQPQCVICLNYVLSGVEEPELILSLHQSAMKQEKEDGGGTNREPGSQEAVTEIKEKTEEKEEGETDLQAVSDITLDFNNTGTSALEDAPLYNDVMLPSTSVLSPLSSPTDPPRAALPRLDDFPFPSSAHGSTQTVEDLELEMLAPYISMDNDYQLHMHTQADSLDNLYSDQKKPTTHICDAQHRKQMDGHLSLSQPNQKRKLETTSLPHSTGPGSIFQVVTHTPQVKRSKVTVLETRPPATMPETLTILLLPSDVLNQLMAGGAIIKPLPHIAR